MQCTATVNGYPLDPTSVAWSVDVGTISDTGLYTAPSTITGVEHGTVVASQTGPPPAYGYGQFTLEPVSVSVTPAGPVNLLASQTQQFTAAVQYTTNTAVTWSISPNVGTISSSGLYTAPSSITTQQTVTVTATSQADTTKSGSATATLSLNKAASSVTVASGFNPSGLGQSVTFTATVSPSWTTGTVQFRDGSTVLGSSTLASGQATYSTSALSMGSHSITAVYSGNSNYNGSTSSALNQTVKTASSVTLASSLNPSRSDQSVTFTATVSPSAATGTVQFLDGSTVMGSASLASSQAAFTIGSLVAGSNPITAAYSGDSTYAGSTSTALMQTVTPPIAVTLSPSSVALAASQTQQFTATVANTSNTAVTWSLSPAGMGTIDSTGLYTAPASIAGQQTVTVTATSQADTTKSAVGTVALLPVVVYVNPPNANLYASQTQQLSPTVLNTTNTAVTWSLSPAGTGTIAAGGLYTAPSTIASVQAVTVTATSASDPSQSASATMKLLPPAASTAPWYNTAWAYRKQITIDHTRLSGTADLMNYPVLIDRLDPDLAATANGGGMAQAGGTDIVFTAADGVTTLAYEIEQYAGATGQLVAWVNVPDLSVSANTVLYLYYGNAAASNQPNPAAVWNSSYSIVEHFSQASGTIDDSTSNGNNATPAASGATYDPNGRIGGDYSFDGTSTGLATIANAPSWNGAFAQYSVEFWVSMRQTVGGSNVITDGGNFYILNSGMPGMQGSWVAQVNTDEDSPCQLSSNALGYLAQPDGQFHHVALVYDDVAGTCSLYSDAVLTATGDSGGNTAFRPGPLYLGGYNGDLDELRVLAGTALSPDWINADYANQSSPPGFYAVNTLEQAPVAGPVIQTIAPAAGAAGTLATITGSGFGAAQGTSTVTFNGVSAGNANLWSAGSITVTVPNGATTGNVVVTVGGAASNAVSFTVSPVPAVASLSVTSGAAGAQVTISGSGFGAVQGTGAVWLGSTLATVVSWSDTQIVATVASNAASGTAQVQQGGVWSNGTPFSVNTAAISSVAPASGVPGTSVTIAGSGFGAAQGGGQVWLGTAGGVVQSWSDGQIVALVGTGSATGSARVLQNGVLSNAVPFTVNSLQIAGVSPTSGAPGTSVTITGSGFGSSQGSGVVWLGSIAGQVTSWSDTTVVATVASGAVSGIARIQQNGVWSNALTFTVPVSGGSSVTLSPNLITMLVGDTHTIQALNSSGQPVTGLTWASSDPTVVSLSTDDPPLLTALAVGHATITAGTGSADVTVSPGDPNYPGTLPLGTVLWSVPGNVAQIVPAVPSPSGVADVFAFSYDGMGGATVQAITSDGTTAWTADLGYAYPVLPDFQGGLVAQESDTNGNTSIVKLDGTTGQPYSAYTPDGVNFLVPGLAAVHTDGTIFTIQQNWDTGYSSVIGIDPTSGTQKFSVPIESSSTYWFEPEGLMIAGDGYAYVPYEYRDDGPGCELIHLRLLRVNSSGAYDDMKILDWPSESCEWDFLPVGMITNADQGIVLTWAGTTETSQANGPVASGLAITTGASASLIGMPLAPGQESAIAPVLQAQDGSFVGTMWVQDGTQPMVAFDQTGAIRWTVPGNYQPQIATADGGLIATDPSGAAITFDQYGNATDVEASFATQSWTANTYELGSTKQVLFMPKAVATPPYTSFAGANQSGNGTSPLCHDRRDQLIAEYGSIPVLDKSYNQPWPRFTPNCFELTNSAHSAYFQFSEIASNPTFGWALIKYPLVVPASSGYGLDKWRQIYGSPRIINSGYRDPVHNADPAVGGKPGSRHQFGDAVDLQNESGGLQEWQEMWTDAGSPGDRNTAQADWREPRTGHCQLSCVHADWRRTDRNKYVH